jgi:hypothetical protein
VVELDDEFTQIGLDGLDIVFFEKMVEVHLLGNHRFALDDVLRIVATQDVEHDAIGLGRVFGPVHLDAVSGAVGFELLQKSGQLLQGAALDGIAGRAQLFEIGSVREHRAALVDQNVHRFA